MKLSSLVKRTISAKLREVADKIDADSCELSSEQAMDIMAVIGHEIISKEEACSYLNLHKSKFNYLVKVGKLPQGRKRRGFKELIYYKDELDAAVKKLK